MTALTTQFTLFNKLPPHFEKLLQDYYVPLAEWIHDQKKPDEVLIVGINGAQGTGKSTLADFLALHLHTYSEARVASFSLDDLYLTKSERKTLAKKVHPLLDTRGVPGTHDVNLGKDVIESLKNLEDGEIYRIPVFDKAIDDRAPADEWVEIEGPIDIIIMEGWCVGSFPDSDLFLDKPINDIEENADRRAIWRKFVNQQLATTYQDFFDYLDLLVFLQVPSFESIFDWRLEQETRLAEERGNQATDIMGPAEIANFVQLFQRVTELNLKVMPSIADAVVVLNKDHGIDDIRYQRQLFED